MSGLFGEGGKRRFSRQHTGEVAPVAAGAESKTEETAAETVLAPAGDDEIVCKPPPGPSRGAKLPLSFAPAMRLWGQPETVSTGLPASESSRADAPPPDEADFLDPWHATYSSAVAIGLARKGEQELMETLRQTVPDLVDGRVQIFGGNEQFPWCAICYLIIHAADGSRWAGSGWLAGPRTVITAGHCVYLHGCGGWAKQVEVFPACNGPFRPQRQNSADLRSVRGWVEHKKEECDYGAILLSADVPLSAFNCRAVGDEQFQGMLVNVFGYPTDKAPGTLWGSPCLVREVRPRKLVYNSSIFGGLSGSPVFCKQDKDRFVVGIHTHGDLLGNSATRITAEVLKNIQAWNMSG